MIREAGKHKHAIIFLKDPVANEKRAEARAVGIFYFCQIQNDISDSFRMQGNQF